MQIRNFWIFFRLISQQNQHIGKHCILQLRLNWESFWSVLPIILQKTLLRYSSWRPRTLRLKISTENQVRINIISVYIYIYIQTTGICLLIFILFQNETINVKYLDFMYIIYHNYNNMYVGYKNRPFFFVVLLTRSKLIYSDQLFMATFHSSMSVPNICLRIVCYLWQMARTPYWQSYPP